MRLTREKKSSPINQGDGAASGRCWAFGGFSANTKLLDRCLIGAGRRRVDRQRMMTSNPKRDVAWRGRFSLLLCACCSSPPAGWRGTQGVHKGETNTLVDTKKQAGAHTDPNPRASRSKSSSFTSCARCLPLLSRQDNHNCCRPWQEDGTSSLSRLLITTMSFTTDARVAP